MKSPALCAGKLVKVVTVNDRISGTGDRYESNKLMGLQKAVYFHTLWTIGIYVFPVAVAAAAPLQPTPLLFEPDTEYRGGGVLDPFYFYYLLGD